MWMKVKRYPEPQEGMAAVMLLAEQNTGIKRDLLLYSNVYPYRTKPLSDRHLKCFYLSTLDMNKRGRFIPENIWLFPAE